MEWVQAETLFEHAWKARTKGWKQFRYFGSHWGRWACAHMYTTMMEDCVSAYEEIYGSMAKKPDKREEFVFKGYVNHNFTVEEKEGFKAWKPSLEEQDNLLDELILNGYKLGCSYDTHHQAFVITLTCRDASSPNYGLTLSARAGDRLTAERAVMYKHFSIFEQDWTEFEGRFSDPLA